MRARPESAINSCKSRASNLIVSVELEIKHKIYHKSIEKGEQEAISLKNMRQENDCFAIRYLLRNRYCIASRVANQITAFAIVY